MKKTIFLMLFAMVFTATIQSINAQEKVEKMEKWPGVTAKILAENETVKVTEVTFAVGAVADWHSHPQHSAYAVTDIKMKEEEKGKEAKTVEMKAGETMSFPPVTHKTTNIGKKPFTAIVTEIKETHTH